MTKRRFVFKLEPLRAVREHAERVAMGDLAGELRQAAELELQVDAAEGKLADARHTGGGVTAADLATRQAYVERIERELEEARRRVQAQELHVRASRARLQDAARERETVDKLEERQRAAFDQETRRRERDATDELSVQMHLLKQAAS
jgi:flagellar export protein FliJ